MAEPRRALAQMDDARISVGNARFLIIEAPYYEDIAAQLRAGAEAALTRAQARFDVVSVPGALEIPIALAIALDRAPALYQGAIALGCIIRGETYHFEIVANESARALTQLVVERKLPFGNGILTVETETQALERASVESGDKGGDAARAALALYRFSQEFGQVVEQAQIQAQRPVLTSGAR
ncbi:6,7-dimethyl-8-ribityllumazine synthase [Beijerinckia indica]|uniref:6,7-dimethyl-8-ribityllumazine synthase n=1 Tax=Beijerinckia indica subsp. indica (strain ATCC 9039 / DSM 1715 / NCIMB 8712) TaxID=395963 RepID=RISB_BEII9|nr:6,7-dimethyl-8-ribityllumazine synthase [Beijerinckia indica]B2ICH3.1 RecName: Full=6,7-dimethyl-8-ribityllumazine synthase; Short=DMRL synthase; Short=LS; Short=Lumazine synthase [Beijerinckia indica subsp. indica ATCC 9039]ACB93862.1 6,7-dimethyl-8-ribityllumazine synthase [Beijerinckia indica subsp. indica ATCC 9039]